MGRSGCGSIGIWVCSSRDNKIYVQTRVPLGEYIAGVQYIYLYYVYCVERAEGDLYSAPRPVEVVGVGRNAIAECSNSGVGERVACVDVDEQPRRDVRDSTGCGGGTVGGGAIFVASFVGGSAAVYKI